jgi:hypothetical protein
MKLSTQFSSHGAWAQKTGLSERMHNLLDPVCAGDDEVVDEKLFLAADLENGARLDRPSGDSVLPPHGPVFCPAPPVVVVDQQLAGIDPDGTDPHQGIACQPTQVGPGFRRPQRYLHRFEPRLLFRRALGPQHERRNRRAIRFGPDVLEVCNPAHRSQRKDRRFSHACERTFQRTFQQRHGVQ